MTPSPTQSDVLAALRSFLLAVLPPGVLVLQSQANKASEPSAVDFVLMTPNAMPRLSTNIETTRDCGFIGSISGIVMTASSIGVGTIVVGHLLFGLGLTGSPTILSQTGGTPGGIGTYTLSIDQGTVTSETLACGVIDQTEKTEFSVQLDVHGPASADNVQVISNLFRSSYATQFFADMVPSVASPLYSTDPVQAPFVNDQNQYENRWVAQAFLQVDQTVSVPQQFADSVSVVLRSVSADFPPS